MSSSSSTLKLLIVINMLAGIEHGQGVYQHFHNTESISVTKPEFAENMRANVTAVIGQTTHLLCTVNSIGDRTVSWIRKSDLHVLTSGKHTFTGDRRISSLHPQKTNNWSLQIKYIEMRDAGEYQCQVNTEPKISYSFYLTVEEARAEIQGKDKEVIVKKGSSLELHCLVNKGEGVHESMAVFWYLNSKVLDWMGQTGPGQGAQVHEDNGVKFESILRVKNTRMEHDGIFTCRPTLGTQDTVRVHIIDGEQPAAMQSNNSTNIQLNTFLIFTIIASIKLFL